MRTRLPDRRDARLINFDFAAISYVAQFSCHNGKLLEMFLNSGKEGSTADIIGREAAVMLSIALQFGTPLDVIYDALPKLAKGEPAGPVGMAIAKFREVYEPFIRNS